MSSSARSAVNRCSRSACARSAASDLAEMTHGVTGGVALRARGVWGVCGACSRMRWALVPLMPKEEMAARRGWLVWGQGIVVVRRETAPLCQLMWGVGWLMWRVLGRVACCMARVILMMAAMPAAAWVWPMLDLMEPRWMGWFRLWP